MTSNGYWGATYAGLAPGGIIALAFSLPNENHVMAVTYSSGNEVMFNAHTSDRYQSGISAGYCDPYDGCSNYFKIL